VRSSYCERLLICETFTIMTCQGGCVDYLSWILWRCSSTPTTEHRDQRQRSVINSLLARVVRLRVYYACIGLETNGLLVYKYDIVCITGSGMYHTRIQKKRQHIRPRMFLISPVPATWPRGRVWAQRELDDDDDVEDTFLRVCVRPTGTKHKRHQCQPRPRVPSTTD
jgi:hypothetical protein